jgi:ketosteroid isomerase-like protein
VNLRPTLALVAAIATACGGGAPAVKQKDIGPPVDEKQAESDAGGTVKEIYATISRGNTDNLFSVLSDPLFVFGPRALDATATRSDALVALGKVVGAKNKKQLSSGKLEVVASPGGHSAWAFDVVNADGGPIAVMVILRNDDDLWSVTAAALARTPSMKDVRAELKKASIVPPGANAAAMVDPRAEAAVDKFKRGLLAQDVWGDDLASRTEALWIGPSDGDVARGKKEIKKRWQTRLDAETRMATTGKVTAEVTPDGQLAWVTAPVTRVEKDEDPLPLREFAVFEKDGENWKMIALHEALSVDAPGAGAAFVKILPPAAAVKEAPPPPPEEPKEKKKKKKKKKSSDESSDEPKIKKKKHSDDDEETTPKKKKKHDDDVEADEDKPKKKMKHSDDDSESSEDKPKKKKLSDDDESDDDKPKKKKKKHSDDDE